MGMVDVPTTPGMTDVPTTPGMTDVPGHNYNQHNLSQSQKQKKSSGVIGTILNIIILLFFVFIGLGIYSSEGDTIPQKIKTYTKDMMQLQQSLQKGGYNGGDD